MSLWDNESVKKSAASKPNAFTLIELMVVMAIVVILTVVGYINISSRILTSRLESAVQTLASDLTYARSAAMLKGCPVRFIFCADKQCTNSTVNSGTPNGARVITGTTAANAIVPARFYAIQRYSQAIDPNSPEGCYNAAAVNATGTPSDGFNYWDYDRRPVEIPLGTGLVPIYGGSGTGPPDQTDWISTSGGAAANSLWFNRSGDLRFGVVEFANVVGTSVSYRIVFQLTMDNCTPATSGDCAAYLISIPANGGTATYTKCNSGTARSTGSATPSNTCWQ